MLQAWRQPSRSLIQRKRAPSASQSQVSTTLTQALSWSTNTGRVAPVPALPRRIVRVFCSRFRCCMTSSVELAAHSIRAR